MVSPPMTVLPVHWNVRVSKPSSFSSAAAAVTTLNTEPGVKVEERKRLRYTPSYRASPS